MGSGGATSGYSYQAAIMIGLCSGPIHGVNSIWDNKSVVASNDLNFLVALGSAGQTPWGHLTTHHPDQAVGYSGMAYMSCPLFNLDTSAGIQNLSFEVHGLGYDPKFGVPDTLPDYVIRDFLSRAGFPSANIGDLVASGYVAYCQANGFVLSPALTEQIPASDFLKMMAQCTNSEYVWSQGKLSLVPYGDTAITANGATFTPNITPIYDLNDDDFIVSDSSDAPVLCSRITTADAYNHVQVEYVDRAQDYNVAIAEAKDQADIEAKGLRTRDPVKLHAICEAPIARAVAQLLLQRGLFIRNTYTFKLGWKFCLLEPLDLVTLTDSVMGLSLTPAKIVSIEEDEDGLFTVTAEEYPFGVNSHTMYPHQSTLGYLPNYSTAPGSVNTPAIFEVPFELAAGTGPEIWFGLDGGPNWGGCDIWVSRDGVSYEQIGTEHGKSRMGYTTAVLPTHTDPDSDSTLSVDISPGGCELLSGTTASADAYDTLCWVGGEFLSYATAALTGTGKYDLSYLRRGAYGSTIEAHAAGSRFVRTDTQVARYPYPTDIVGQTVYFKFVSSNIYGGGIEDISSVTAYPYLVAGSGLPPEAGEGNSITVTGGSIFKYLAGSATPTADSITLTATLWGSLSGPTWKYWTGSAWAGLSGTNTGLTYSLRYDNAAWTQDYLTVICQAVVDPLHPENIMYDEVTISKLRDGSNAISVVTTNLFVGLPASSAGVVSSYAGSGTTIHVYRGATELNSYNATPSAGTYQVIAAVTSGALTLGTQDVSGISSVFANHSAMTTDTAVITYTINVEGLDTRTAWQTLTKVKAGVDGTAGMPMYTWIKYADTPTTGMSDSNVGKKYIGISGNNSVFTPSTNYNDYVWSLYIGTAGKVYDLNITGGVRGFVYDSVGANPVPTPTAFSCTLTENGTAVTPVSWTWTTGGTSTGLISGSSAISTFTPTVTATYDMSKGNNFVALTVTYGTNPVQTVTTTIPIVCSTSGATLSRGASPPASPLQYTLWYNTATSDGTYYANTQYQYVGTSWLPTSPRGTKIGADGIYTGTLTATQVNAVAIDAASITAGTITGRTLQTATTLQRMIISSASNDMTFYCNNNQNGTGVVEGMATIGHGGSVGWAIGSFGTVTTGNNMVGVYGVSDSNAAIYGYSARSIGVKGESVTQYGVVGSGISATAFTSYGGKFNGPAGAVVLVPSVTAGVPTHSADKGTVFLDSAAIAYLNTSASSPGTTWVKLVMSTDEVITWYTITPTSLWTTNVTMYYGKSLITGIVYLKGIANSNLAILGSTIFTLPAGYRPPVTINGIAVTSTSAFGSIKITTAGVVSLNVGAVGTGTWTEFDGVCFPTT